MVSLSVSPLETLELIGSEKPKTPPPRRSIAASNERRVRVEGS
jgi:hypothetical protein